MCFIFFGACAVCKVNYYDDFCECEDLLHGRIQHNQRAKPIYKPLKKGEHCARCKVFGIRYSQMKHLHGKAETIAMNKSGLPRVKEAAKKAVEFYNRLAKDERWIRDGGKEVPGYVEAESKVWDDIKKAEDSYKSGHWKKR